MNGGGLLNAIVHFSLRFRGVVIALGAIVIAYGLFIAKRTKLDVFPEFAPPQITIQTEAPGLSAEQVETLVTRPLENALNGSPNLTSIRSQSIQGLSAITVVFTDDTDIYRARQMTGERLVEVAGRLPLGVEPPRMGSLTSTTSLMLAIGLTSKERTPMELRTFVDWTLLPRLLGVPGVAKVDVFGGERQQLQVQVQPERLLAHGLTIDDVLTAARKSTAVRGAGFVENANQRIVLRTEGQSLTPEQLAQTIIAHQETGSVRLGDVAQVVEAGAPKFGDAQVMGERGVTLLLASQYSANTLEVTNAVERALDEMKGAFVREKIAVQPRLFRPASFIEASLRNINVSLAIGGALVAIVLFLFLLDLRTAFISFISIPISLLAAVIVLDHFGITLNTITLGGFAIAIGVVVDDAIIDVENILRRLRENRTRPEPRPLLRVILDASLEVRSSVVYATFIVALVFMPVLMMSGVQGRLFAPLATSFILATLASLLVALTVTPALSLAMLSRIEPHSEPRYVRWLKDRHRAWLERVMGRSRLLLIGCGALCLAALAMLPFFGGEFLPEFREGHFIIHMSTLPGTSLQESIRLGTEVTHELLKNPHVRTVSQEAGRAENGEDTWGAYLSEFHVDLQPLEGEEAEFVGSEIRSALSKFTGASFSVMPFLAERMEETVSGATAEVVVKIFGDDLDVLDQKGDELSRLLTGIPGASDTQVESQPGSPEIVVRLRPERLLQYGFHAGEVLDTVQTAYQGTPVAQTYHGNRVTEVAVILAETERKNPRSVASLMLANAEGARFRLDQLADVFVTTGRSLIVHDGAQRRQQVTCNVAGRDVASFVAELRRKVESQIEFPAGTYAVITGAAEAQAKARQDLLVHSAIAGVAIVLLLAIVFQSGRNLLLVLVNLPFALVGGVLAVFGSGGLLSVGSLVGFVTLFGITMRNSIMMISHFEHLIADEGLAWNRETALRGARERLVPILMTALVTGLGLLPLAIGSGEPGREIEGPMAIVILGGLLSSTALNLLVLPTLALRFARFEAKPAES